MSISANISCGISCPISRPISKFSIGSSGLSDGGDSLLEEYGGASAAFSLRDLGGSGPVVRLRRASDNAEKDFYAGEVTGSVEGSELLTNGDFSSGSTGWTLSTEWSIVGGQAVLDGTQTSNSLLKQDSISGYEGVQGIFKLTFDITCSDYTKFQIVVPSAVPSTSQLEITADGTYSIIFDTRAGTGDWGNVRLYSGNNGVTATIDNVSLVPYTPTAAEQWVIDDAGFVVEGSGTTEQNTNSAYATTWYDQSASNEQVFSDPEIQGSWGRYGNTQNMTISSGRIEFNNAVSNDYVVSSGPSANYVSEGSYICEIDYENSTVSSNQMRVFCGGGSIGLPVSGASGTASVFINVPALAPVGIKVGGSNTTIDRFDVVGVRMIDIGNPATQTTATAQPLLIRAGVTHTVGGKAALDFDGTNDYLEADTGSLLGTAWATFSVFDSAATGSYEGLFESVSSGLANKRISFYSSGPSTESSQYNPKNLGDNFGSLLEPWTASQYLLSHELSGNTVTPYSSGVTQTAVTNAAQIPGDTSSLDKTRIGRQTAGGIYHSAGIQELILYPSDQSANRIPIEENISKAWCIPYPTMDLVNDCRAPEMAAGYSLRDLGGGGNVVRLRRASDNAEQDFTAADIKAGTAGSELITNGRFSSGLTGWTADSNWTESGGQAVSDGSVSFGLLYQDNIISSDAGVYYKVTFEVPSFSNPTSVGFNIGTSIKLITLQNSGITSTGTYTAIFKTIGGGSRFGFYTGPAHTMTIDNVSVKEYTPSALELWAMNSRDEMSRQTNESAFCTTWYDQSASNEQVFEDPTITGSWTETDPNGEVAVTSGLVRFSNVTTSCSTWASGSEDIPAGTYRFELDYENNTATGVNNILVGIHTIINFNIGVSYPAGSGTISFVATVGTAGKLKITAAGTLDGSQSFDITGIRVVDLGNPATQSTSTAQPLLIRAGVTATENGKAALEFDGTDDFLTAPSYGVSQPIWSASVTKLDPSGSLTNRYLYCTQDNSFFTIANSNDFLRMHAGTSMTESSGGYSENQQLLTFAFDSINSGGWANGQGITFSTNDAGTGGISANMDIGRRIAAGNDANWNGGIQELIFYPSDQSANRTIIETSINAYYGIWLDDPWNDFNSWSDNLIWSED